MRALDWSAGRVERGWLHLLLWAIAMLMMLGGMARGQTAHVSGILTPQPTYGSESQLPITPSVTPAAVVLDGSGNVYVSDFGNDRVVRLAPLPGGGYTQSTVVSAADGLVSPRGMTFDDSGNLYVTDFGGNQIWKVACATTCGAPSVLIAGLSHGPQEITWDPYGYLWFTAWGDAEVWSITTSGSGLTNYSQTYFGATPFSQPAGLAWQTTGGGAGSWTGNLFISDYNNQTVTEWSWTSGGWVSRGVVTAASGLNHPTRMSLDGTGSLFIADTGNNRVVKIPWDGAQWGTEIALPSGALNQPVDAEVDGQGNVYIADWQNSRVLKERYTAVDFGRVAAGSTSATGLVYFRFDSEGTLGSRSFLTEGSEGLDFRDSYWGNCWAGHYYHAGETCAMGVNFTPGSTGVRHGAVVLKNSAGAVFATAFVTGVGTGPQVGFFPGAGVPATAGIESRPSLWSEHALEQAGVATDAAGNVYLTDAAGGKVLKLAWAWGSYSQSTIASSGLTSPNGIAVDGAGNVIVADTNGHQLYQYGWNGSSYGAAVSMLPAGVYSPAAVLIDGAGKVLFSDGNAQKVYQISGGSVNEVLGVTGVQRPSGLALDAAGNLYVSDAVGNAVVRVSNKGWGVLSSLGLSGLSGPAGVAIDASGAVYVADANNNRVVRAQWNGTSWEAATVSTGSLNKPLGVALDGSGNLLITSSSDVFVAKENYGSAPSVSFADTEVTATSSDSPKTVVLRNIGNQNLTLEGATPNPSFGEDFPANSADTQLCGTTAGTTTMAPGASCDLSINFTPNWAGSVNESLVVHDNHLNALAPSYASQSLTLTGTSYAQLLLSPEDASFSDQVQGTTSNAWTFNVSNTLGRAITGVTYTITGTNASNFAIQSTACGTQPATVWAYSSCTLQVTFTPSVTGNASDYYTATLSIEDSAHGDPVIAHLHGTGTAMNVDLSPSFINFGGGTVGGSWQTQRAVLTNAGSGTLTVSSVAMADGAGNVGGSMPFAIAATSCGTGTLPLATPFTLAGNANCTITMSFAPAAAGSFAGQLIVKDNGLNGSAGRVVTLNGSALGQSILLSPDAVSFGSQTVGGTSSAWTLTLNNGSNAAVNNVALALVGSAPGSFVQSNTCAATLAAHTTCTIQISFKPQSAGALSATLQVTSSAPTITAALNGTGTAPTAALAPDQLNFGSVATSSSAERTAILTNTSGGPLNNVTAAITAGGAAFTIATGGNSCPSTLAASEACSITVTFAPNAVTTFNGTLTVTSSAGTQSAALVGTGTSSAASVWFSPDAINFGNQTAGSAGNAWGVTINNSGSTAVSITSLQLSDTVNFVMSPATACTGTLPAGGSCFFQLKFAPSAQHPLGTMQANVTALVSGGNAVTASLTGTSIAPTAAIAPGSLNFGSVVQGTGPTSAQMVTLSNTSTGPMTISSIVASTGFVYQPGGSTCGATLAAYSNCAIAVAFAPTAAQSYTGSLVVTGSAGAQTVVLTGTGTSNVASGYFSPASIYFGSQTVGSVSNAWGVTLNNTGNVAMTAAGGTLLTVTGDFAVGNDSCGTTLAAGSSCFFTVKFTPSQVGTRNGTLSAVFSNGSITANLEGWGLAPTAALAPNSLNFGDVNVNQQSGVQTANLSNTSAGAITISGITASAPFVYLPGSSTCGATLAAYSDCSIGVAFAPVAGGNMSGTLSVVSSAAGSPHTVSLNGTGQKQSQWISFSLPGSVTYGVAPITLSATSSSGLTVSYSMVSGPGSVSGNQLTITGAGAVVVAANQAGNASYHAAQQETQSMWVNQATPALALVCPTVAYDGAAHACTGAASGVSGGAVSGNWAMSPASATAVGAHAVTGTFNSTDGNYVSGGTASGTLTIQMATPSIHWAAPAAISYGTALGSAQLNASSPVAGSFCYTPAAGAVLPAGSHTLTTNFTPADVANYNGATSTVPLTVNPATPSVTAWPTATAITYGQPLGSSALSGGTASTGGSFAWASPLTVLPAGTSPQTVIFTPADPANFATVTGTVSVTVNRATPVVGIWPTAAAITYGQQLGASALSGGVSTPSGSFSWTAPLTALPAGTSSQAVIFTPADAGNYTTLSGTVSMTVNKATPLVALSVPAPIDTVTPFDVTQLHAAATFNGSPLAGSFTYNPAHGTLLTAGSHALSVSFLPTDGSNFNNAVGTTTILVYQTLIDAASYTLDANPPSLTMREGESRTVAFTLHPQGGFIGDVALSCSDVPMSLVSCVFTPPVLHADGSNAAVLSTLTITVGTIARNEAPLSDPGSREALAGALLLPGLFSGAVLWLNRKRMRKKGILIVLAMGAIVTGIGVTGCGVGIFSGSPVGAHTLTIKAQAVAQGSTVKTQSTGSFTLVVTK